MLAVGVGARLLVSFARSLQAAELGRRTLELRAVEIAAEGASVEDLTDRVGAIEGLEPASDTNATADHRRHLAGVLARRALTDAVTRGSAA